MSRVTLDLTVPILRVGSAELPQPYFTLVFDTSDGFANGVVKIQTSATEDFATAVDVAVTSYDAYIGGTWQTFTGNTIPLAQMGNSMRVKSTAIGTETYKYARVVFTANAIVYQSPPFIITSITKLNFSLAQALDKFGQKKPLKVKITDKITASNATYTIKVETCNNALDAVPVWEDMTTDYKNKVYHTFTNNTKETAKNWAIQVRYTITKAASADSIEITELYVAYL